MSDGILYIDLGAHTGAKAREYAQRVKMRRAILFEPNLAIDTQPIPGVETVILRVAAWGHDGMLPFYIGRADAATGSSLLRTKTTGDLDYEHPIYVWVCDFARWLMEDLHWPIRNGIEIKFNVEGAEYAIFSRMADLNVLGWSAITAIHLSTHSSKLGLAPSRDAQLDTWLLGEGFKPYPSEFGDGFTTWRR